MLLGNDQEALQVAERSLASSPDYKPIPWMLIAANAQLGQLEEARRWLARYRALAPGINLSRP
jgi:hypothetical protein